MTYSKSRKQTLFKHLRKYFSVYDIEVVAMEDFGELPYSFKLLSLNVPLTADNKWRVFDVTTKGDLMLELYHYNASTIWRLKIHHIQHYAGKDVARVAEGDINSKKSLYFTHKLVSNSMNSILEKLPS
jgi:hypothetical protein